MFENHNCSLNSHQVDLLTQHINTGLFVEFRRKFRSFLLIDPRHPLTNENIKSSLSIETEKMRHLVYHYYIIHPFSMFTYYSDYVICPTFMLIYILMPVAANYELLQKYCKLGDFKKQVYQALLFLQFIHIAYIVKEFFTGYFDSESSRCILNSKEIAMRYIRRLFIFDLLSVLNVPLVITSVYFTDIIERKGVPVLWLGYLKLVHFPRVIRTYLTFWKNLLRLGEKSFTFCKLFHLYTFIVYWSACLLFFFVVLERKEQVCDGNEEAFQSIFFSIMFSCLIRTLLAILIIDPFFEISGYRTSVYVDALQLILVSTGFFLYIYVISQIHKCWIIHITNKGSRVRLLDKTYEFTNAKRLPKELKDRILGYVRFSLRCAQASQFDSTYSVAELEITYHLLSGLAEKVYFLKNSKTNFLRYLAGKTKSKIFMPGELLCEVGGTHRCIEFIIRGIAAKYNWNGVETKHISAGSFYGEFSVFQAYPQLHTIVALTPVKTLSLNAAVFEQAEADFKEDIVKVRQLVDAKFYKLLQEAGVLN